MTKVTMLKYGNTKCYLVQGTKKNILIDTDWAGTLLKFFKSLGEHNLKVQDIDYLFITHYHPDHMGLAQDLMNYGIKLVVLDTQLKYIHQSDYIFKRQKVQFKSINDKEIVVLPVTKSRNFLRKCGIDGEILSTPGHSECSVSYILDNGEAFVGDLYPMEQVALYDNPVLTESWRKLKQANIKIIHFAHYPDEKIADYPESDF
ncbi:MAG: MBL fold metallo-hydrolase [Lactobacillus gasseri]|nr:MBL fold metallo-hydrolase [Lactobacillus gasseri]MDU7065513.1 MBL fold metallo-hydrolase [Lactobacillus crispatus]